MRDLEHSVLSEATYWQISRCLQVQIWMCAVYSLEKGNSEHVGSICFPRMKSKIDILGALWVEIELGNKEKESSTQFSGSALFQRKKSTDAYTR